MPYFIGIDSSTTATKALIMDESGAVAGVASSEYPYDTPRPLWSEQDPHYWWKGTVDSVRAVIGKTGIDPKEIAGIGLTGQMHGLVLLDAHGEVIRPALLWNDQRTGAECDEIRERVGKERLIQLTGNDALTGFTAPKVLWVRNNEPEHYSRIAQMLLPKDYVRYRLTGDYATDRAGAAGTLLLDVRSRDWSPDVLEALDIPRHWLPDTHEGPEITGRVSADAAAVLGIPAGIPVVGGGGDQAAQAVGVGAVEEGIVALTLGTSGVVFASANQPAIEPEGRLHGFCHAVPGRWHMMGVMLSAAGSLRWHRDTIAPGIDFEELVTAAADIPEGSEGLLFLPYLTGERTPHPDPYARGAYVGLTVRHTRNHMTRSVLEGVGFGLKDSFELLRTSGLPAPRQVRISGGGAKSAVWRQILADILGAELVTVNTTEGAAYGAALLAGVGAGAWPDVDTAARSCIRITGSTPCREESVAAYALYYDQYRALYPALKPINDTLSGMA
ncbi:MAG: xylulokinase [Rhodothermales bacterium]